MMYPTLFPFGVSGMEDKGRWTALGLKSHVKHLFHLNDTRFQEHYSFLFSTFNMLQRRSMLLHTSLKVKHKNFLKVASTFASVSPETLHVVSERASRGDYTTANNDEERRVLALMKEVKAVTTNVLGSNSSHTVMQNEIHGLMIDKGLPSFYITINLADIYNPVISFLAGSEIDVNDILGGDLPKYLDQTILVVKNPVVAARFFNTYLKAFIKCILGYNSDKNNWDGWVLGVVKAHYGCVEVQGQGTLHCHMLVWMKGSLNPNEIKDRIVAQEDDIFRDKLLSYLDDTISNYMPEIPGESVPILSDGYHTSAVHGGIDLCDEKGDRDSALSQ